MYYAVRRVLTAESGELDDVVPGRTLGETLGVDQVFVQSQPHLGAHQFVRAENEAPARRIKIHELSDASFVRVEGRWGSLPQHDHSCPEDSPGSFPRGKICRAPQHSSRKLVPHEHLSLKLVKFGLASAVGSEDREVGIGRLLYLKPSLKRR